MPLKAPEIQAPETNLNRVNLLWLSRLRWASVVGESLTVLGVQLFMSVRLPLVALVSLIALQAVANVVVTGRLARQPRVSEAALALLMAFDLVVFTALLYFTGGPSNPFSSLYLIHIALATLVLPPRFTWALVGLSLLCSAALFGAHEPLVMHHSAADHYAMHLQGMWVALGVSASFIVYFLDRLTRALADRESALTRARARAARNQQLAALATLAAGAAHELASPLSTIAVVSKELERGLGDADEHVADVRLIRSEVTRCNDILSELAVDAGQARGEPSEPCRVDELVSAAIAGLADAERVSLRSDPGAGEVSLRVPRRLFERALRSVVKNALMATSPGGSVTVSASRRADRVSISVEDDGAGMPEDVRQRAVEPFFTTRPSGQGMGLGLFLAASIVEQLGGELELTSEPGRGTTVTLELPT
jgi:two-component system sensor histidine kinase RegB